MSDFLEALSYGISITSWIEWLAVSTLLLYVIFAAKRMIICWFFAFISSCLYIYICFDFQLYIEAVLQVFYAVMAIVGWWFWNSESEEIKIKKWSITQHSINIVASSLLMLILGFIFDKYTDQASPYLDAFTTCFSLTATYMVTQKILGNWIYWIVIDIVAVVLYSSRNLQLSAVLYAVFTMLAVAGFASWYKQWKRQIG